MLRARNASLLRWFVPRPRACAILGIRPPRRHHRLARGHCCTSRKPWAHCTEGQGARRRSIMPTVEKVRIFLASPSDVAAERRYAAQIVEEINRTVAHSKGVILEVVRWEKNTYPGYGKDAQAIVN